MNIGEHKRQSILAGFNTEIVKGDENEFSTPESFEKAVADNKWLVYTEENIEAFEKALNEQLNAIEKGGEGSKDEILEKAKKDFSKLTKKLVVDKRGFSKTVWVGNGGENTAVEQSSEDSKNSHQQLLDEKIEKKNHKQMAAHKEDAEYEAQEKKLNDMAHEVVNEWSDKIQDIHLVTDSPEAIQQFQDIANEYGYKDKYDGKNWLENWIEGEGLTDEKLKEIHGKLSKIK